MPSPVEQSEGGRALLSDRDWPTRASEGFVKQFMAMLAQKDKQFGFPNLVDNLFFLWIECYGGLLQGWLHTFPPDHFSCANHLGSRMVEWFQTRVSRLTYTPALCYGIPMNSVYLRGEMKTPGWMIHRNCNRATSTFAV